MADKTTTISVPRDVSNPKELTRFLARVVEQVDKAYGYRGDNAFVSKNELQQSGVSDLGYSLTTVSAAYAQAEIQGLATQLANTTAKVDELLGVLRNAKII